MKLYNSDLSPNALRVRAVVAELGLDLETVEVDMRKGEQRQPDFLAMNPNGKVPVLVDDTGAEPFVLWESRAIIAYLAGMKPESGLYPGDMQKRAIIDQWSYWGAVHFGPTLQRIVFERVFKPMFKIGEPSDEAIAAATKELTPLLSILDANLADRKWVAGDLSIADFSIDSVLVFRVPAGVALNGAPNVQAWIARMEERPSWQAAIAPVKAFMAR